jgi:quinol---cytochrome c reductase iron-sulfur subunit, bacillus type
MSTVEKGNKGPSGIWPVSVAVGIAVLLVGLVVDLLLVAAGGAIVVCAAVLWAREARSARGGQAAVAAPLVERRAVLQAERFPRSGLLARATVGLGALVGLGVALPATGAAILSSLGERRQRPVDLGPVNAFPEGQYVIATFLTDPEAGEVSRRTAYVRNNGLVGDVPSFTILSSRCTHVGCPTQPNGPTKPRRLERTSTGEVGLARTQPAGFGCPCHGSQFDTEGNRTAGPAPRALDRYRFLIRNGRLVLGARYSVDHVRGTGATARIQSFPLKDPGQPVTGPESWLYHFGAR